MATPDYLLSQASLFGADEAVGFGTPSFNVRLVDREKANAIVRANHYSKAVFPNSLEHLGVFIDGSMVGVLQWGQAMNPASGGSIVTGSTPEQWRELNRMWLSDAAPRNSESRAISYCLKWMRRARPAVAWVQSFADERCAGLGVVYQACSFLYLGEHTATFWELDGEWFHNIAATCIGENVRRKGGLRAVKLQASMDRAVRHDFRQFRYFRALKSWASKALLYKPLPYPKRAAVIEAAA